MSNILIIKHGSLGDLIQANGAIKDIKKSFSNKKLFILTSSQYSTFMSSCPYLDGVLIDRRLPRWNIFYLAKLKKMLERFSFEKVFDLQNSSRSSFYRKFLFKKEVYWSGSNFFISSEKIKEEKNLPVLDRIELQLKRAGITDTQFTKKPDLNWAVKDIKNITNQYFEGKYILIFPFCSPRHNKKKWPYYNELINLIKKYYGPKYNVAIVPGPKEIEESKKFEVDSILNKGKSLNISELISIISGASYVVGNDSAPAHVCSHLNIKGLVLFGSHTSPEKVSIGSGNFQSIQVNNLVKLNVSTVFDKIKSNLN